jgi:hypothetical protein
MRPVFVPLFLCLCLLLSGMGSSCLYPSEKSSDSLFPPSTSPSNSIHCNAAGGSAGYGDIPAKDQTEENDGAKRASGEFPHQSTPPRKGGKTLTVAKKASKIFELHALVSCRFRAQVFLEDLSTFQNPLNGPSTRQTGDLYLHYNSILC